MAAQLNKYQLEEIKDLKTAIKQIQINTLKYWKEELKKAQEKSSESTFYKKRTTEYKIDIQELENRIYFIDKYFEQLIQLYEENTNNINKHPYYDIKDYIDSLIHSDCTNLKTPNWIKIEEWTEEYMYNKEKEIKTDEEKIVDVLHEFTPKEINDLTQDIYNLSEGKLYVSCEDNDRRLYLLDKKEKIDPRILKLNEIDDNTLKEIEPYFDERIPYIQGVRQSSSKYNKNTFLHFYKKDFNLKLISYDGKKNAIHYYYDNIYTFDSKRLESKENIKEILSEITNTLNDVKEKIKTEETEEKYSKLLNFINRYTKVTENIISETQTQEQNEIKKINNKYHKYRLIGNDNNDERLLFKKVIKEVTEDFKKEQVNSEKETYLDAKIEALYVINKYSREASRNFDRHRGCEGLPNNFNDEIISYVRAFSREELNGYKTEEIQSLIEPMIEKIYEKLYPEPTKRAVEETIDILDDYIDQCNYYDDFTEPDHYDDPYDDFPSCDVWDEPTPEPEIDPNEAKTIKFAIVRTKEEIIKEYNKLSTIEGYDPKKNNIYNFLKEFIEKQPHITKEKTVKLTINNEEKTISDFTEGYINNFIKNIQTEGYETDKYFFYNDKTIIETKEENKKTLNNLDKIITSQSLSKINVTNVELKQVSRWKKISYIDQNGKKQSFSLKPNQEHLLTINKRNERKISNLINDWAKIHYADLSQSQSKSLKK